MPRALPVDHATILWSSPTASEPYYDALLPLLGFEKQKPGIWKNELGFHLQFRNSEPDTSPYERYGAGVNHIGFGAPDEATVRKVRDGMKLAGFEVPDIQHLGGATALFMKDPDGFRFEITYYPPGVSVVG